MLYSVLAVGIGGAIGSIARWLLGNALNHYFSALPLGTLVANLISGYIIGLAAAFFLTHPSIPIQWRLLVITGCMGGLSTFSAFSLEIAQLFEQQRWGWACGVIGVHVIGSVAMTLLGLATISVFNR